MKLKQISVFLENRPGQLSVPIRALAEADLNVLTLSLADTQQFGILRLLVNDPQAARDVLEKAGCVVKVNDVVAVDVPDRPGGLASVLDGIESAGLNLEYMYAFTYRSKQEAMMIFRFEDPDSAIDVLASCGFNVVDAATLDDRVG
jgi:hypothetical protein